MPQVLVISTHSFVDLITNSSSELFVAETQKSLEAVKEILVELVRIHNAKEKLGDNPRLADLNQVFGGMFKEPVRMDFTFQPHKAGGIWHQYQLVHDRDHRDAHPVHHRCESRWQEIWKLPEGTPHPSYDEVWKEWFEIEREALSEILVWTCQQNNIPYVLDEEGLLLDNDHHLSEYGSEPVGDQRIARISHALSWDYSFKAGDIIIESVSDNTIPYWMFEDIENVLNTSSRRHLG